MKTLVPLLFFFLFVPQLGFSQSRYAVIEHVHPDTIKENEMAAGYFVIKNNSKEIIEIREGHASTERLGPPRYDRAPIGPKKTTRVDYTIPPQQYSGKKEFMFILTFTNDSVIFVHVNFVVPPPGGFPPDKTSRLITIIEQVHPDTVFPNDTPQCYFVIKNNSNEPIWIRSVISSTERIGAPHYSKDVIAPGRTSRIDYEIRLQGSRGPKDLPLTVQLSNDSFIVVQVKCFGAYDKPNEQPAPKTPERAVPNTPERTVPTSPSLPPVSVAPPKKDAHKSDAWYNFRVIRESHFDTLTYGETCLGFIEIKNRFGGTVCITNVSLMKTHGVYGNVTFIDFPKDSIHPGDSVRINYRYDSRASAPLDNYLQVDFSDNSRLTHPVRINVRAPIEIVQPGEDQVEAVQSPTDTCRCNIYEPLYPGGFKLFSDSIVKLTKRKILPDSSGTIYIQFTVTRDGSLIDPVIFRSIDPEFEAELVKNLNKPGKWIPVCWDPQRNGFTYEPMQIPCAMKVRVTVPVKITQ